MAIVPVTQIASNMLPFIFLGGLFFGLLKLAMLAVAVYLVLTWFQLITLPVEFAGSRRAKIIFAADGDHSPWEEARA
jgi:Zn-dependent membrane protease YugP